MAETQKQTTKDEPKVDEPKVEENAERNSGTPSPEAGPGSDSHVPGVDEGTVKALRDDAGLNQLPGHEADIMAWQHSPEGQAFAKTAAKDNEKAAKDEAKAYEAQFSEDGKTEAEAAYVEALGK